MERSQLEGLTVRDLKYYTKSRRITSPINANKHELVEIILGNQAKRLSEMARKALSQVQNGDVTGRNFETVDLTRLEPHTSAYSSQTSQTGTGGSNSMNRDLDSGISVDGTGLSGATGVGSSSGGGGGGERGSMEDEYGLAINSSKRPKKVKGGH